MTYQIDFTASNYKKRWWRKLILRLLFLATVIAFSWGVQYVYTVKNEPTLNMRLAEYETVTRPIEEMNAAWDTAAKEYAALVRYYRLVWAANPTNFLTAMASSNALRFRTGLSSRNLMLTTGGDCRLDLHYAFSPGDKAEQVKDLEREIAQSVTSLVQVVGGKVDVQGVRHENLLDVESLDISVKFALPDVRSFPAKEKTLADCVNEIAAMRKKVQETRFADKNDAKGVAPTAQAIMMAYLPSQFGKDKETGKAKPDFPELTSVLNVSGWFGRADQFIQRNKIPGDEAERKRLKEAWNGVGEARWPWDRFRVLDNEELVNRTKTLVTVSDGVKRFKGFLEKRHADNLKKLEPFVEAYDLEDIGNKPLVESDLKKRVAAAAGISTAGVSFKNEANVEPAVLKKDDEKFAFTWVRWTLSIGSGAGRDGARGETQSEAASEDPIALDKLADCARRVLTLGPGYVLDTVKVSFGEGGAVAGAVLEGLLPVKKVEALKGGKK